MGTIWTKLGGLRYGTFTVGTVWKVRKPCLLCRGFRHRLSERQNGNFRVRNPGTGGILFLTVTYSLVMYTFNKNGLQWT